MSMGGLALAHPTGGFWTPGEPLVPCGITPIGAGPVIPCDQCELLHLVKHIIDFILIAAAPILATFFFIVAGVYMMLGGANPGMLSQGKSIFKNTFIGLLIVLMAWLITNTLIRSLTNVPVGPGLQWYEFSCSQLP